MSPVVNVDIPMHPDMLDALNILEAICVCKKIDAVDNDFVNAFLTEKYGSTFAATFKPEYLFNSQAI
jgi:hypothetical protein